MSLKIDDYLNFSSSDGKYLLTSTIDLKNLLAFALEEYSFRLTNDIDLSRESHFSIPVFLADEFDGDGYAISNYSIEHLGDNVGLFGYVGGDSTLGNVFLNDIEVSGYNRIGGLAGYNKGTVTGCKVKGTVSGITEIGGLVGYNNGKIINCTSIGSADGEKAIGGLVGLNNEEVQDSSSSMRIQGDSRLGGLVGENEDKIVECHSTGIIEGSDNQIGGLVGINGIHSFIKESYSTGSVSGYEEVGGFIGWHEGGIVNCYSSASVNGSIEVGGFVGLNHYFGMIDSSYSFSNNITGYKKIGGFVGCNYGDIDYCYSTGQVRGDAQTGGFSGKNGESEVGKGYISDCFWDMETSGQESSSGAKGKTTNEMMTESTYTGAGWDFDRTWYVNEGTDYPQLFWEDRRVTEAVDSDDDRVQDGNDDFPNDPAASVDTDEDGYPDEWNEGMEQTDSTTGLILDDFPDDPAASVDTDGDGFPDEWNDDKTEKDSITNLKLDAFPHDPTASMDENYDGVPDEWNTDTSEQNSTSDPQPGSEPGPDDPHNNVQTNPSSTIWYWILLALGFLLLISILIVIFALGMRRRRGEKDSDNLGRVEPSYDNRINRYELYDDK